jgi:glycosyltransferase involved in cell wall biosynthesis
MRSLDARAVIVGFGDYRDARQAPVGRSSPARSSTGTSTPAALVDVAVVPSIFPEAFGMVAAEAASAGVPDRGRPLGPPSRSESR